MIKQIDTPSSILFYNGSVKVGEMFQYDDFGQSFEDIESVWVGTTSSHETKGCKTSVYNFMQQTLNTIQEI